jgi:tryptophan synthase alpha chain
LSESSIGRTFDSLRERGRTALIPYLTAGYPDLPASADALRAADEIADLLEVGVPFSDPLADGPTIQRSTFQALEQGMTLTGTLELIARCRLQ